MRALSIHRSLGGQADARALQRGSEPDERRDGLRAGLARRAEPVQRGAETAGRARARAFGDTGAESRAEPRERIVDHGNVRGAKPLLRAEQARRAIGPRERHVDVVQRDELDPCEPRIEPVSPGRRIGEQRAAGLVVGKRAQCAEQPEAAVHGDGPAERDEDTPRAAIERGAQEVADPRARGAERIALAGSQSRMADGLGRLDEERAIAQQAEPCGVRGAGADRGP